jgi:site-specific DNA recombinase
MAGVGIYARVSKAEQGDPTSVPVQLGDCRERAAEEGWDVVAEYADEGISAWNTKRQRPEYERLLGDVEAGRIDTILVRETERLLRSQKDAVRIADLAEAGRLKLIASTMESDINFGRARDRKDFRDRASSAQFYSDFLSEKVRRTKAARRTVGAYNGGGPAFGYTFADGGLVINPEQAALIHEAVRKLGNHVSLYRISMDWNAAGRTTVNGARWRPATLRRMLTGDHLTGGKGYPAILDEVEAAIVRNELGEQPKLKEGRPAGRKYPLVGYMRCSECSVKLIGSSGSYRCGPSHGGCGRVSIRATPVERFLLTATFREGMRAVARNMPAPTSKSTSPEAVVDTSPLLAELRGVEARVEEVADALADGTLTVQVAGRTTAKLEERRRALTEELARNLPPTKSTPVVDLMAALRLAGALPAMEEARRRGLLDIPEPDPRFQERWETRTLTEAEVAQLRDVFAAFIDHVVISPRERRGKTFDPSRVDVVWA